MQRKNIMVLMISLSLVLLLGSSYALLRSREVGTTPYVINVGSLQVTFEEGKTNNLSLENMYPMSDKEGSSQSDELGFTVKNTGTVGSYYDITLEETSTNPEFKSVIRFISNKDNQGYSEPKTLSEDKYIDVGGYLGVNASSSYKVKVWLDYNAGNTYMNETFTAKVVVNSFQESEYAKDVIKSQLVKYEESSKDTFLGGLVAVNTNGDLYNETIPTQKIREYRYSGPSVNNYVTYNDELWRIIGVFKDEVGEEHTKIVRNEVISEQIIPDNFVKNNNNYQIQFYYSDGRGASDDAYWNRIQGKSTISDWTTAGLMYFLNSEKDENEDSNLGYLHYLNDESKNMIAETTYYLGNVTISPESNNNIGDTAYKAYINERKKDECPVDVTENSDINNCNIWYGNKPTWKGKIALMYASDVGYSSNSKFWKSIDMFDSEYTTKIDNSNWMFLTLNRYNWLLNPSSSSNKITLFVALQTTSINKTSKTTIDYGSLVRPSLYLKTNVKITSGTGEQTNPYTLSLD